jgi:predicted O-methyltransferase YrrM
VAAELLTASRAHDARQTDRLARFRNLEPETAELLNVLVRAARPRRLLEIRTSNGYSTLWLADAAEAVGGEVVSVEIDGGRSALAAEALARAGLTAELRVEDGAVTLRQAPTAACDLVFLDAERPAYAAMWPDVLRTLRPGGLAAIDNATSHAAEVAEVTALISRTPDVTSSLIPIGAGLLVAVTLGATRPVPAHP